LSLKYYNLISKIVLQKLLRKEYQKIEIIIMKKGKKKKKKEVIREFIRFKKKRKKELIFYPMMIVGWIELNVAPVNVSIQAQQAINLL
jgi:hypothetical protein